MTDASDPADGAVPGTTSAESGAAVSELQVRVVATTPTSPLVRGQRWHGYQVGEPLAGGPGWGYSAMNVGMLEEVVLRALPIDGAETAARAKAWNEIKALAHPGLLELFETKEENGYRFEISRGRPVTTLREWAACRRITPEDAIMVARSVWTAVRALHDRGIVHLNLRPDTIYFVDQESGPVPVVGGLEFAMPFERNTSLPMEVDPYYAPPEAVGQTRHPAGRGLCGWDYWSLGRVIQEILLGKHVVGVWLKRDIAKSLDEMRPRAEALLMENEPNAPRAGAVELMTGLDARLASLLRGLLTTSQDARWGPGEMQAWLNNETVRNRYEMARSDRLFFFCGKGMTIPETAEFFSQEANVDEGVRQLFDPADATTFKAFLELTPACRPTKDHVDKVRALSQVPAWQGIATGAQRKAIAAAVWATLSDEGRLTLGGKRVDAPVLRAIARSGDAETVDLLKAMTALPFIQLVEPRDADAARALSLFAATLNDALNLAQKHGWVDPTNPAHLAPLMQAALESDAAVQTALRTLRSRYAATRIPELQKLYGAPRLTRSESVIVVYAGSDPVRFQLVTHDEWNTEQLRMLRARGERLARAIFWLRLQRAMRASPFIYSRWPLCLAFALAMAGAAWEFAPERHSFHWTFIPVGSYLSFRLAAWVLQRAEIRRSVGDAVRWTLNSRQEDCGAEAARVLAEDGIAPSAAEKEFARLNAVIADLPITPKVEGVRPPPAADFTWAAGVAAWLIPLFVLGPSLSIVLIPADSLAGRDLGEQSVAKDSGQEDYPLARHYFFEERNPVRREWRFAEPPHASPLPVNASFEATPEQVAAGLVTAQRVLKPYAPKSVYPLVMVPVPFPSRVGLVVYDARRRALLERRVLLVPELPAEGTWYQLNEHKVLYVGAPGPATPVPQADAVPERETLRVALTEQR